MIRVDQQIDERLFERIRSRRLPFQGTFELTRRCNLRCSYCYVGFDWKISPEEELSREEIYSLLDQVAAAGCLFLTFTGGEPLSREDFPAIYSYAVQKGIKVVIFTNGTLIDRTLAALFREQPPLYLEITMPGISEEVYERVTGVKGSYERFRKAL
ncbi:MAG: radical SAM protein, partial [Elusimicrobiota bacterium]|nr:radical SAM protein [Elusimicrobiota bacterium]